jgi:hypothetical protein
MHPMRGHAVSLAAAFDSEILTYVGPEGKPFTVHVSNGDTASKLSK